MFERRITGAALARAAAAAGHHLTPVDISNVRQRIERYYPPSNRVRNSIREGLKKLNIRVAAIDEIEELIAE